MVKPLLAMALVTLLWGANFTAAKIGVGPEGFNPYLVASVRIFFAAIVFYFLLPSSRRKLELSDVRAIFPLALTGIAVNQTCFAIGIQLTTPSHSAIICTFIPIFVLILARFVIGENFSSSTVFGMLLAVAGAMIVVLGSLKEDSTGILLGDLISFLGTIAFALYTVLGRRVVVAMERDRVVTYAFVLSIPFMIPFFIWGCLRQDWHSVTWKGWGALAYIIVGATLLCYSLHFYALSILGAGQVAIFTDLQPVIATAIAVLIGLDRITEHFLWGGGLALAGVVLVQWRR